MKPTKSAHAHPDIAILAAYLEHPEGQAYANERLHLSQCASCRRQVTALSAVVQNIVKCVPRFRAVGQSSVSEQQIADFVDAVGCGQQTAMEQKIRQDPLALKSALHYATHATEHTDQVRQFADSHSELRTLGQPASSWWLSMLAPLRLCLQWRASVWVPVWAGVPVAAVLVAVLLFAMPFAGKVAVVGFQDPPYLLWQTQSFDRPGMGFFSQANQQREPAKKIHFNLNRAILKVQWAAVRDAQSYDLQLVYRNLQGDKVVKQIHTQDNAAKIDDFRAMSSRQHQWRLRGQVVDSDSGVQRYFQMEGGFVVQAKN